MYSKNVRPDKREKMNLLLSLIIAKSRKWSELKKNTNFNDMSLTRYLNELIDKGAVTKGLENGKPIYISKKKISESMGRFWNQGTEEIIDNIKLLKKAGLYSDGMDESDIRNFLIWKGNQNNFWINEKRIRELEKGKKLNFLDLIRFVNMISVAGNPEDKIKVKIKLNSKPNKKIREVRKFIQNR